ncbi:MAG: TlpA disulfide reductase family protein [Rhodocyclaceae bacterium]|nr:TlpA disulfide reductase family protein [Rhodocyclaceae bacterium]
MVLALLPFRVFAVDSAPLYGATLADQYGKPVALTSLRGKPILVNFWARWCPPCRKEFPDLMAAQAQYQGSGLVVVGIAIEDAAGLEKVRDFAKAYGMDYTILLGGDQGLSLLRSLGNESAALPYSLVLNRTGQVVATKLGVMKKPEMDAAIQKAL